MLPLKGSQWPSSLPVFSPRPLSSQEIGAGQWDQLLPMEMVDTESPFGPLSPLEADDLESPLSADFLQEMGTIQERFLSLLGRTVPGASVLQNAST